MKLKSILESDAELNPRMVARVILVVVRERVMSRQKLAQTLSKNIKRVYVNYGTLYEMHVRSVERIKQVF